MGHPRGEATPVREGGFTPSDADAALPVRVQLSRAKGWRMPPNTVKVDRTTRWGNPWPIDAYLCAYDAVDAFRRFVTGPEWEDPYMGAVHRRFREGLPSLRGKNLACWCKPGSPCHADVLLELANATAKPTDPTAQHGMNPNPEQSE